ncbi:PASTA domain-containing protein [Tenacibaculum sp. TC6]|uniref:PASTA domain-containing protein n=1 Tax=Tenacibaculum sp. TC6 TaxID=3423223 RepID=UPI003D35DDFC
MSNFSERIKGLFEFIKSKSFLKQLIIAVVGVFVMVFLLKWWLGITTNHGQKIQVPNLDKLSLAEVEKKLNELDLEFVVIDSATYNPEYPKKSVIEQNPEAGDFVKENRKIYLTLNPSKYRDVEIPDLNGRTRRQATTHLRSIGFIVGDDVTWVKDLGKDVVRGLKHKGVKIEPGTKLPKQSTINLILGDGNGGY